MVVVIMQKHIWHLKVWLAHHVQCPILLTKLWLDTDQHTNSAIQTKMYKWNFTFVYYVYKVLIDGAEGYIYINKVTSNLVSQSKCGV